MITFIATAYEEQFDPFVFIGSMLCQSNRNWKAIIYNNGPNPWLRQIIDDAQSPHYRYFQSLKAFIGGFNDPRIIYKESSENRGAWGCYNRQHALDNLVDTEYVVQTSVQDYWLPNAVDEILSRQGHDFIFWNSIHHHLKHDVLDCKTEINHIDWGNFAIKSRLARQIGIRHPESFTADGQFVRDCFDEGLIEHQVKIEKILTIHN